MKKFKYNLPSLNDVKEGFKFWKAVKDKTIHLYFDSSSLVDMLVGIASLFQGKVFKDYSYNDSRNLVYAIAYRNWLGELYILPPHSEEILDTLQSNERLFPRRENPDIADHIVELWERLLATEDLSKLNKVRLQSKVVNQEILSEIQQHPYHPFLGMYLSHQGGDWRKRFKFLRERQIIRFVDDTNSHVDELAKSPLFGKLMRKLNAGKRTTRTVNNHIDALALCILNEKLNQFKEGKSNYLPLFYCNQESIFEAVTAIQQEHQGSPGEVPFMYTDSLHGSFSIIQNSSFFIIEGFLQAMKQNNDEAALEKFYDSLTSIVENGQDGSLEDDVIKVPDYKKTEEAELVSEVHEQVMLEFFDRWWKTNGLQDLLDPLDLEEDPNQEELNQLVNDHIEEERQKLAVKIQGFGSRYTIIKKAWAVLKRFKSDVQEEFIKKNLKINAFHDFGPRFNFSDEVCQIVQDWVDRVINAIESNDDVECKMIESEVINDLISVLFEKIDNKGYAPQKLDQLAASIGFFFCFHKYDLVAQVCTEIRRRHTQEFANSANDKYPVPSIALIHAASLFQEEKAAPSASAENEALEIIKCVESKSSNKYKVWIGLSYLYVLLWKHKVRNGYKFRELMLLSDYLAINPIGINYYEKAIEYSKQAIDYLETILDEDTEKYGARSRKYYYATNVYILLSTFFTNVDGLISLRSFVQKLEDISTVESLFQESRFSDTLARYYFRLAIVSQDKDRYDRYMLKAKDFNDRAIASEPKQLYVDLKNQIMDWEVEKGFEGALEICQQYENIQHNGIKLPV